MKYFYLNGSMKQELFDKFINFCNQYPDDKWGIVIDSGGGGESFCHAMLHIIDDHKDCVLISMGCYSSAFELFYLSKCEKLITTNSMGMFHLGRDNYDIDLNGKPSWTADEAIVKRRKETSYPMALDFAKQFMTTLEFSKFKQGKDIYFTFKRMQEIFPDATII